MNNHHPHHTASSPSTSSTWTSTPHSSRSHGGGGGGGGGGRWWSSWGGASSQPQTIFSQFSLPIHQQIKRHFSTTYQTISQALNQLPRKSKRYRNAVIATGFIFGVIAVADWMTTAQLKSTGYYRFALKVAKNDPRVIEALGTPISEPFRVGARKRKSRFELDFNLTGPKQSAHVEASSTIDPRREFITHSSFSYIVVQPQQGPPIHVVGGDSSSGGIVPGATTTTPS